MDYEAQALTGEPARKNGRFVASLALAMAATVGVSYTVVSATSAPVAELAVASTEPTTSSGKPVVHAYVDAL